MTRVESPGRQRARYLYSAALRVFAEGTLAGRYEMLEVAGEGGTSVVVAAYDMRLDRRVALKLLRPREGVDRVELESRLVREALALARISHPNVVQVYDAGTLEDGSPFLAMEYVEGQTLRSWSKARRRPWREVLAACLAAGRGLAAAHAAGILHRDFKPDNVLVAVNGSVRLADFGLARARPYIEEGPMARGLAPPPAVGWGGIITREGSLPGTLRYLAPELLQKQPADVRSDLYAFCVSLYELLYEQPPFEEQAADRSVAPPPASSKVPAWVTRALLRGLEEDPRQRPAGMDELLEALARPPPRRSRRASSGMV